MESYNESDLDLQFGRIRVREEDQEDQPHQRAVRPRTEQQDISLLSDNESDLDLQSDNYWNPYQNLFLETYNSIYLGKLSSDKLSDLKFLVRILKNPVLLKLIENYENSNVPYKKTKYIEGPHELYVYKLVDKNNPDIIRYIYLFGETHVDSTGQCEFLQNRLPGPKMTFTEYILDLLKNTPSFFDLYIELRLISKTQRQVKGLTKYFQIFSKFIYNPKTTNFQEEIKHVEFNEYSRSSTLDTLRKVLEPCISPEKRTPAIIEPAPVAPAPVAPALDCKLARIHVVDSRSTPGEENKLDIIFMIFYYFNSDKVDNLPKETFFSALFHLIKSAKVFSILSKIANGMFMHIDNQVELLFNLIAVKNQFVKKQLDKSYYKIEIENFIRNKIKKMIRESGSFFPLIYNFVIDYNRYMKEEEEPIHTKISDIQDITTNFLHYTTLEMDLYCLSRIFKNFGQHTEKAAIEDDNGPKVLWRIIPYGQPKESHNIIVYTGSNHTETYLEFLDEMKENDKISNKSGLIRQYINASTCNNNGLEHPCNCIWMSDPIFMESDSDSSSESEEDNIQSTEDGSVPPLPTDLTSGIESPPVGVPLPTGQILPDGGGYLPVYAGVPLPTGQILPDVYGGGYLPFYGGDSQENDFGYLPGYGESKSSRVQGTGVPFLPYVDEPYIYPEPIEGEEPIEW